MDQPPAAADVLVEARRNLQRNIEVLIGSGISRQQLHQQLHQLVEESGGSCSDDPFAAFLYGPDLRHRPRISVSSTSSGSSGNASLWSINTASSVSSAVSSSPCSSTVSSWPCSAVSATSTPISTTSNTSPQEFSPAAAAAATAVSTTPTTATTTTFSDISASTAFTMPIATQRPNPVPAAPVAIPCAPSLAPSSAKPVNTYCCTSCDTTFKRKYDWKRHEDEFHERWKKYPCPEPGCNRSFWGANTFNQHHKQSHNCKSCPHSERVVRYLRKRKYWACGFCSALHPSRERHVEHVARDFESGKTKVQWMHSKVIYGLLHQPLVHDAWKQLLMTKQADYAGRTPNFSWDPIKTGRAQGFLEGEVPGKLQDHLEFFSGNEADAQVLVRAAYELADIMFMGSPVLKSATPHELPSQAVQQRHPDSQRQPQDMQRHHQDMQQQQQQQVKSEPPRQSSKRQRQVQPSDSPPHTQRQSPAFSQVTSSTPSPPSLPLPPPPPPPPPQPFGSPQAGTMPHQTHVVLLSQQEQQQQEQEQQQQQQQQQHQHQKHQHHQSQHHQQQQQLILQQHQQQQQQQHTGPSPTPKFYSPTEYPPHAGYFSPVKSYPAQLARPPLDRELPSTPPDLEAPLPPPPPSHTQADQFEYLSNPVPMVIEDWQSFSTTIVDEAVQRASQAVMSAGGAHGHAPDQDWHMTDYFDGTSS